MQIYVWFQHKYILNKNFCNVSKVKTKYKDGLNTFIFFNNTATIFNLVDKMNEINLSHC